MGGRQSGTGKTDCAHRRGVAWAWKTTGRGGTKARVPIAGWPPHWQDRSDAQGVPWLSSSWQQSCAAAVSMLAAASAIGQQAAAITPASACAGRASEISKARSIRSERIRESVRGRPVLSRYV